MPMLCPFFIACFPLSILQVVLVANSLPAINDVTAAELRSVSAACGRGRLLAAAVGVSFTAHQEAPQAQATSQSTSMLKVGNLHSHRAAGGGQGG